MDNRHIGSSLDDFLAEEGILEEVTERAVNRLRTWQAEQGAKHKQGLDDEPTT